MSNPWRDNIWGMEVAYCTALPTEPSSNNCSVEGTCTPLCSGNFCMILVFYYFFNKKCICCLCNRHFDIFYDVLQFCIPFPKFEIYRIIMGWIIYGTTSLWYLSCKGAVKNRVDSLAAPYLEVLKTSLYGVSTVFRWWKVIPSTQISPLNSFLFLLKQGLPSKNRYQSDSKSIVVHKQRRSEGMLLLEWLELNWVIVLWSVRAA